MNYYNALLISYFHNDSNQKHVQVHAVSTSLLFDKIKIPLPFDYRILVGLGRKLLIRIIYICFSKYKV